MPCFLRRGNVQHVIFQNNRCFDERPVHGAPSPWLHSTIRHTRQDILQSTRHVLGWKNKASEKSKGYPRLLFSVLRTRSLRLSVL